MKNIILFSSGEGTNAENCIRYFQKKEIHVVGVFCNKPTAGVIKRAHALSVPVLVFDKSFFLDESKMLFMLRAWGATHLVLAGFLWQVPPYLLRHFPNRIVNIHPSLLPRYGGKGMFGMHVHEAVKKNKETETGITIHLVEEEYDEGKILFQQRVALSEKDEATTIAQKVHALEYEFFPPVIEKWVLSQTT